MNQKLDQYIGKKVSVGILGEEHVTFQGVLAELNSYGAYFTDVTNINTRVDAFQARFYPWARIDFVDLSTLAPGRTQAA